MLIAIQYQPLNGPAKTDLCHVKNTIHPRNQRLQAIREITRLLLDEKYTAAKVDKVEINFHMD